MLDMRSIIKFISFKAFLLLCFLLPVIDTVAQCPMCKLSAEKSDFKQGLNIGILYLLFFPVLLMGGILVYWYLNRKKFEQFQ